MTFALLAVGLALMGIDFLTAVSAAASAISNVGPGLGPIIGPEGNYSSLPDSAKWLLSAGMLLGRLELFTVIVLFTRAFEGLESDLMGKIYTPKELLSVLIGFDTTSFRSNRDMIDFIVDYLSSHGISSSLGFNDEETKADLIATIGPQVAGGIILSGHTDVVPVAGQDWNTDPFVAHEKGDKIYGRGSCDMKGFIAVVLAMVRNS